jgi:hypothetical protein
VRAVMPVLNAEGRATNMSVDVLAERKRIGEGTAGGKSAGGKGKKERRAAMERRETPENKDFCLLVVPCEQLRALSSRRDRGAASASIREGLATREMGIV